MHNLAVGQCLLEFLDIFVADFRVDQKQHFEVGQPVEMLQATAADARASKVQPL